MDIFSDEAGDNDDRDGEGENCSKYGGEIDASQAIIWHINDPLLHTTHGHWDSHRSC